MLWRVGWVWYAESGWNSKHPVDEIHGCAGCDGKMNVLKVKEGDLDTNSEPEQEEIVNFFTIQHKAYPQWPTCHLLS